MVFLPQVRGMKPAVGGLASGGSPKPPGLPGRTEAGETLVDVLRWTWPVWAAAPGERAEQSWGRGVPAYRLGSGRRAVSPITPQPKCQERFFGEKRMLSTPER